LSTAGSEVESRTWWGEQLSANLSAGLFSRYEEMEVVGEGDRGMDSGDEGRM